MAKTKKFKLGLLASVLALGLTGCASEEDAVQMAEVPVVSSNHAEQVWSTQVGGGIGSFYSHLQPEVFGDVVYAAARDGDVVAIDKISGKNLWKQTITTPTGQPSLSGGLTAGYNKVFVGSENGILVALDATSGKELWQTTAMGEILAKPLVAEGKVIVNTSSGTLQAFNVENGKELWKIDIDIPALTLRGDSSPIAFGGGVFWGMANGKIGAASLATGQLFWQKTIATPKGNTEIKRMIDVDAAPVINDGKLWALGYNGHLEAIDLRSGARVLRRAYSSAKNFTISGYLLYLVDEQDKIYAIDVRNGVEMWQNQDLAYRIVTAPVVSGDYVVVGDAEGYLYWVDAQSGETIYKHEFNSGFVVPPTPVGDGLVIQTRSGKIEFTKFTGE